MEIQKIFSEIDTDEKLYSVLMSEDELALFSEIQKEFNSKAQKARRLANTMKIAGESGINKYKSKGFRTVENTSFLKEAREAERKRTQEEILGKRAVPSNTNQFINNKVAAISRGDGYGLVYQGSGFSNSKRLLNSGYKKPKGGDVLYDHSSKSAKRALDEINPAGGYKGYLKKNN